ncbi:MAG TPA: hypothetical protein VMZ71_02215 [Gemmataceae bacterium]|nr:hypothetical protein [Gemmataceae bacterium]
MPITLSCPSCAKRFRARDESAGKRVKCPYCQAAIVVNADGSSAAPPADPGPLAAPRFPPGPARPAAPVTPGDWSDDLPGSPTAGPKSAPIPLAPPPPLRGASTASRPAARPAPAKPTSRTGKLGDAAESREPKSPAKLVLPAWKKTKAGLFWVLFGLVFLALPGFVEFGKLVYERTVGDLPSGEGWIKIDGAVNAGSGTITLSKRQEIDILAYGGPILIGGLMLTLGRLAAGAAPRASGAKGLFAFSGLFTLLGLASLGVFEVCQQVQMADVARYTAVGFIVAWGLAEVWFLTGLATTGAHLKRPAVARAVGFFWFVVALAAVAATVGWEQYVKEMRPKPVNNAIDKDTLLYEAGARMLGWLVVIGCYWRAVKGTRAAIREFIDNNDEE